MAARRPPAPTTRTTPARPHHASAGPIGDQPGRRAHAAVDGRGEAIAYVIARSADPLAQGHVATYAAQFTAMVIAGSEGGHGMADFAMHLHFANCNLIHYAMADVSAAVVAVRDGLLRGMACGGCRAILVARDGRHTRLDDGTRGAFMGGLKHHRPERWEHPLFGPLPAEGRLVIMTEGFGFITDLAVADILKESGSAQDAMDALSAVARAETADLVLDEAAIVIWLDPEISRESNGSWRPGLSNPMGLGGL